MSLAYRFTVEVRWHHESGRGHLIQVEGRTTPFRPARLTGHLDTWAPAEGGELEDLAASLVHKGRRQRRLPAVLEAGLMEEELFKNEVARALGSKDGLES